MLNNSNDLGESLFKTWTEEQQKAEIEKLVAGFRNGVPIGIFLKMAETIAGSKKKAKKYLKQMLTDDERRAAILSAEPSMLLIVNSFLK